MEKGFDAAMSANATQRANVQPARSLAAEDRGLSSGRCMSLGSQSRCMAEFGGFVIAVEESAR